MNEVDDLVQTMAIHGNTSVEAKRAFARLIGLARIGLLAEQRGNETWQRTIAAYRGLCPTHGTVPCKCIW